MKSQSFFKKVTSHRTKPYQPANENFSITEWQDEFWSSNNPDPREYQLFQSGIWFNECFNEVKSKFNNLPYYKDTKEILIRFQVGAINDYINRQYKYFYEVNNKSLKSSDLSNFVETLEAIIDSSRYILIKINQDKNIINSDISLESWLNNNLNSALLYDQLKHFWMQCLWHEWYVDYESQESIDFITPSDSIKGLQHHKSLSWRDEINQAEHIQALIDWQNMSIQEKHKFLIQPILKVVQIDNNNNINLDVIPFIKNS